MATFWVTSEGIGLRLSLASGRTVRPTQRRDLSVQNKYYPETRARQIVVDIKSIFRKKETHDSE